MDTTTSSSPVLDPQDPLPESNWFWRRLFLIGALVILSAIKALETLLDRQQFMTDFLILADLVLYAVAPSAEQAYKMFQLTTLFKSGVVFSSEKQVRSTDTQTDSVASTKMGQENESARVGQGSGSLGLDQPGPVDLGEPGAPPGADAPFFKAGKDTGLGQ